MSEVVSIEPSRSRVLSGVQQIRITANAHKSSKANSGFFSRPELDSILQVYSRQVMAGEWRDYAIDHDDQGAVFNIYSQLSAAPLFQIYKRSKISKRFNRFQLSDRHRVLKSSPSLAAILKLIDVSKPRLVTFA